MKKRLKKAKNRKGEEGAAIVMVLLISFLLMAASAGLLLETSMNSANVTDSTAEQQAYNAAESGLQSAVNVLRGNSEYQKTSGNKIDFRKAITPSESNDPDTTAAPRLSRWMTYDSSNPDRITLGATALNPYTPQNGFAYSVLLSDPDNVGGSISYSTSGKINGVSGSNTFPTSGGGSVTIRYNPVSPTTYNFPAATGSPNPSFGSFTVVVNGSGTIPDKTRFEISVKMTQPFVVTKVIRGTINTSTSPVSLTFDSRVNILSGSTSTITLDIPEATRVLTLNTGSNTPLNGTMTPVEPRRLLIRSTGFGPRGARKVLEAIIQKDFFNGLSAPATLTLVGVSNGFDFDPGTSSNVTYSGDDVVSTVNIPSIGTTNDTNLTFITNELAAKNVKTVPNPPPTNVLEEMPEWLQDPYKLDAEIQRLRLLAQSSPGRYFPNAQGQTQPAKGDFGDVTTGTGITFIDGDVDLSQQGGGILVCTGKLTLNGGFDYKGLIIVTGAGGIDRKGSGNGFLQGNTVVAPYNPADIINPNIVAQFLSPKYDLSGGGSSTIRYNSNSVANGLTAVSNFVLGVAEK